jgi:serine phosphatase RsbU (regulator of sigma subunit)
VWVTHGPGSAARRILLVEDDDGDAFLVTELLDEGPRPPEVTWVRSLDDAVAALDQSFDCILIDLGLPDASGLDALRIILAKVPDTAVIVLTGLAEDGSGTTAVAVGAQDYLVKGHVDPELLTRSIRYAVERKRADATLRQLYATELLAAETARLEHGLLPTPATSDPSLIITTRYRSGREGVLGGDFFDIVERPDGTLYLLIGDVSGHGPDEAALGVALRIAWRTLVIAGIDHDDVLPTLDALVVRERRFEEIFATLCSVVIQPDRSQARLFLAGHPAPLLATRPMCQLPDNLVGPALGMLPDVRWGSRPVDLQPGWRLMLLTDGLIEGHVDSGPDRLGIDGLVEIAEKFDRFDDSPALVDHLIAQARELHGGDLVDDVAVVVVECRR